MGSGLRDTGKEKEGFEEAWCTSILPTAALLPTCTDATTLGANFTPHTANLVSLMATDGPMLMIMLVRGRLGRGLI